MTCNKFLIPGHCASTSTTSTIPVIQWLTGWSPFSWGSTPRLSPSIYTGPMITTKYPMESNHSGTCRWSSIFSGIGSWTLNNKIDRNLSNFEELYNWHFGRDEKCSRVLTDTSKVVSVHSVFLCQRWGLHFSEKCNVNILK